MRRTIAVLAALGLMLVLAAPQALAPAKEPEGQRHRRPAARVQRLPRAPRAEHARHDPDGLLHRRTPPNNRVDADDGACRRRRVPRDAHQGAARRRTRNTITVGAGDLIGASPADLGALPRRARDPRDERARARRVRRREPRVRRGHRRAPAHAVRRLPPAPTPARREPLPRRVLPVPRRERLLRGTDQTDPAAATRSRRSTTPRSRSSG